MHFHNHHSRSNKSLGDTIDGAYHIWATQNQVSEHNLASTDCNTHFVLTQQLKTKLAFSLCIRSPNPKARQSARPCQWPSDLVQCETFLWGLDHNDPHIGMDLTRQNLDALVERVVKADRLKTPITQVYGPVVVKSKLALALVGFGQVPPASVWQYPGKGF